MKDLELNGAMRIELEWIKPYPHLGAINLSFVNPPSVDFKMHIGVEMADADILPPLKQAAISPWPWP